MTTKMILLSRKKIIPPGEGEGADDEDTEDAEGADGRC
jgi:hypothetical protein